MEAAPADAAFENAKKPAGLIGENETVAFYDEVEIDFGEGLGIFKNPAHIRTLLTVANGLVVGKQNIDYVRAELVGNAGEQLGFRVEIK